MSVPATALAQPEARTRAIDVNLFRPSPSRYAFFTTELTKTAPKWQFNLGFLLDYQKDPLVIRSFGERVDQVVAHELTANVMFSIGLPWRMEIGIDVPVVLWLDGSGGQTLGIPGVGHLSTTAFGDIRLTPKIQVVKAGGFGLGFAGTITLPTGKLQSFHGERSINFIPKLLLDYEYKRIAFTGMIGYAIRNQANFNGLVVGDELMWAVGSKLALLRDFRNKDQFSLIGEVYGRTNGNDPFGALNQNPIVAALGFRVHLNKQNLHLTAGVARGIHGGYGAPVIQPFLGITWAPKEKDSDGDGIPDKVDKCPTKFGPEKYQGCPDTDNDGVPDNLDKCPYKPGKKSMAGCPIPDKDDDGIADKDDKCPDKAGPKENQGCPWPDSDNDGIPDNKDKCPKKRGLLKWEGCPDSDGDGIPDHKDKCPEKKGLKKYDGCPDTDGDGIPDNKDRCPNQKGPADNGGCPKTATKPPPKIVTPPIKPQIKLAVKQIVLPQIRFDFDSAKIQAESHESLNELAKLLNENTTVTLRIEGHTDTVGNKAYNLKLSQRRAEAVRKYLVDKGVGAGRLVALGFGDSRPVDKKNKKSALNRRVEFHITGGIPEGWKVKYK